MTLENWLKNRWLDTHNTSVQEITNLMEKIEVNKTQFTLDELTPDWKMTIIFNSILTISRIALYVSGYKIPSEGGHHEKYLSSLRYTLEIDSETLTLIQAIRKQRIIVEYDSAGVVSLKDIDFAYKILIELEKRLNSWLKEHHPEYLP